MASVTAWCYEGRHQQCPNNYQKFLIDPRTNKIVWLDEWRKCECRKRGCPCYVKPADRTKTAKVKRRKRKS